MDIPVTILGGYLGAGKTTLINHLLTTSHGRPVTVLVNDFGAVNIDANLITDRADQLIALSNGCVCCSIEDDLAAAIDAQIRRTPAPEHIVIEASGVAEPARIASYAQNWPGLKLAAVVCVVDAETIRERASNKFVGRVVQRQIRAASLIVLNKIDMIDAESLAGLSSWLDELASGASIVSSTYGNIDPARLLSVSDAQGAVTYASDDDDRSARFFDAVITLPDPVDVDKLRGMLASAPPSIHRMKGFIADAASGQTMLVQCAGKRLSIDRYPGGETSPPLALVLIGTERKELELYRLRFAHVFGPQITGPHEPVSGMIEPTRPSARADTRGINRT